MENKGEDFTEGNKPATKKDSKWGEEEKNKKKKHKKVMRIKKRNQWDEWEAGEVDYPILSVVVLRFGMKGVVKMEHEALAFSDTVRERERER